MIRTENNTAEPDRTVRRVLLYFSCFSVYLRVILISASASEAAAQAIAQMLMTNDAIFIGRLLHLFFYSITHFYEIFKNNR